MQNRNCIGIKEIKSHTGTKKKISKMRFKVSWIGFDEDQDSWLSYQELRNETVLEDYIRNKGIDIMGCPPHLKNITRPTNMNRTR